MSRQGLANIGKTDNGVVSVTSLWANERIHYPVDFESCTPGHIISRAVKRSEIPHQAEDSQGARRAGREGRRSLQAMVADSFYGEDEDSGGP